MKWFRTVLMVSAGKHRTFLLSRNLSISSMTDPIRQATSHSWFHVSCDMRSTCAFPAFLFVTSNTKSTRSRNKICLGSVMVNKSDQRPYSCAPFGIPSSSQRAFKSICWLKAAGVQRMILIVGRNLYTLKEVIPNLRVRQTVSTVGENTVYPSGLIAPTCSHEGASRSPSIQQGMSQPAHTRVWHGGLFLAHTPLKPSLHQQWSRFRQTVYFGSSSHNALNPYMAAATVFSIRYLPVAPLSPYALYSSTAMIKQFLYSISGESFVGTLYWYIMNTMNYNE